MPEPTFAQPERRSFLIPLLIALAVLAIAGLLAVHLFPATTVNIAHVQTTLLPTHTTYKTDTIVVGSQASDDTFYVVETLRIDNQLRVPIFLNDFTLTFTNPDDAELTQTAVQKTDLATVQQAFPALVPMLAHPLLRESSIEPGQHAEGSVLFALRIPKSMWDARKAAVVKVDLYHLNPVYQTIPK